MRWGHREKSPDIPDFALRYVRKFAYIPTWDNVEEEWVWLERFVQEEYWSPTSRAWRSNEAGFGMSLVFYDCRTEAE